MRDLRIAVRTLARSRGFGLAAVVSLGLGIAASAAVFSVAYNAVLNPFPYRDPWGIVGVKIQNVKTPQFRMALTDEEMRAVSSSGIFSETMRCTFEQALWTGNGDPDTVRIVLMSGGGFQFLGVPALLGRTITPADAPEGGEPAPVAVLSYVQWQKKFGGDPNVLNTKILLSGKPYIVIGVMPPRFTWYGRDSVWAPISPSANPNALYQFRARLKPGVSLGRAAQQLDPTLRTLAQAHPRDFPRDGFKTSLISMKDFNVGSGSLRKSMMPLIVAVGLLLLIACSNVANLLLARATAQRKEIAVRSALGASRGDIIRQVLVQSVLLGAAGAATGVLLAGVCLRWIVQLIPRNNLPDEAAISMNSTVLLFSAGLAVFTAILFGLAPALQMSRVDLQHTLKDIGRGQTDARGGKLRATLVVVELMLAMFLLVSAAFTLRSFVAMETADLGFRPEGVLLARIGLPNARYRTPEQRSAFFNQVEEQVASMPQVRSVALATAGIPYIFPDSSLRGDGMLPTEQKIAVAYVSAGYYKTLEIPLRKGRLPDADEVRRGDHVAVVNETAVRQFWPAETSPLGREVTLTTGVETPLTIIGVIADSKNYGITEPTRAAILAPVSLAQQPFRFLAIRTAGRPEALTRAVRGAIHDLDTALPMVDTTTLEADMALERVGPRFMMVLFVVFAGIGLILAACGTYGVISYSVSRRTYEFGIRMALGAQRGDILADVVRRGLTLAAMGVVLGLAGGLVVGRVYRGYITQSTYLRNFNENDPVAIGGVALGLLAVAMLACYIPARRAAANDPVDCLRYE